MIAIKSKYQSQQNHQYKSPFVLSLQWLAFVVFQTVLLGTLSLFKHLFNPISLVFHNTQRFVAKHVSLASLYEFVRLSLIANGFIPAGTFQWNSLATTDDELETCLEYSDLVLPTKAVSLNGIWPLTPLLPDNDMKRVPSSSNVLYDVSPDDLGTLHSSRADFAPFPTVEIDTLRVSSENILLSDPNASSYDQPLNDSKLLASPFSSTSTSAQKALPQPKPSTASSKKKKTRKPTAADPAIEKSAANPKRKTNKHSTSLPVNAFQPTLTTTLKGPKSPKSPRNIKPRFDDISASADTATNTTVPGTRPFLQKKRDSSFSSDHSLFADTAVPTCPASHLVSAQNGSKKLKKPLLSKKKFFEQTAAPQQLTAHNKTSTESLQQVIEEKGFKLVKKKFKKKKSLSVDSSMDKSVTVARPPVPATQNVMVKVNNAPKTTSLEVEDRKGSVSSVWRAPLLESDNQDISDIMDAALHNISELSDNDDNADINRYSSPVSSNSSCPSPVSVKWPLDNRYFGNNGISSPLISGVAELNSFQQPSPWSPKPEDNFPLNHYNQGACYPVNGFASSPVPQAVSPISMYPPQSLLSAVDRHLVVSTAAATSLTPTVKRSNTRVTNSTLTWSVPDHLRSHLRNF